MKRSTLYPLVIVLSACLGSAATNVGDTETFPLVRVDGLSLPQTISDASGKSVQVTRGSLTMYSYSLSCDYKLELSNGSSFTGSKSCDFGGEVKQSGDIAQMSFDASAAGGPQGLHTYDFNVNTGKPCACGRLCAHPGCNILVDTVRGAQLPATGTSRLQRYKIGLSRGG